MLHNTTYFSFKVLEFQVCEARLYISKKGIYYLLRAETA